MSTPEEVATMLIKSFNNYEKELFLSLAATGAISWVSGIAGKAPHAGQRPYVEHQFFASNDLSEHIADLTTTANDIIVDQGGRKVVLDCNVTGMGVGNQKGQVLNFSTVMMLELDADCKIVVLREFADHLAILDFFGTG